MVILTQEDYEKLGAQASEAFQTSGVPLNDTIYKFAVDMGLNPAQIKNVCWAANTSLHLSLFEKRAEDKMVEFPVSDPDYVIKRLYTPPEQQPLPEKLAEDAAMDFMLPLAPVTEKVAEEIPVEEKPVSEKTAADRKAKSILAARKIATEMDIRRLKTAQEAGEIIHSLAWDVRRLDFNVSEFEKDAFAMHGEAALLPLNWMRELRHSEKTDGTKLASTYERIVDDAIPEMKKLADAINKLNEIKKYSQAISWFQEKVGESL